MVLVALFYLIDEFCKEFEPKWRAQRITSGTAQRNRPYRLNLSEVLTIIVWFHYSDHRTFKGYYLNVVKGQLRSDFPRLVSYNRFLELMAEVNTPDNNIETVTKLARKMQGKLFGDRGYISKDLFAALWSQGT